MGLRNGEATLREGRHIANPHVGEVEEEGAEGERSDVEPNDVAELQDKVHLTDEDEGCK